MTVDRLEPDAWGLTLVRYRLRPTSSEAWVAYLIGREALSPPGVPLGNQAVPVDSGGAVVSPFRERNFGRDGRLCCCSALSSKLGLIRPTCQVVPGSAGLGFGMLVVHPFASSSGDRSHATNS